MQTSSSTQTIKENELDPRSKLCIVFALSSVAVFVQKIWLLALILMLGMVLTYLLGENLHLFKRFGRIIWLFVGIAVIQSIFTPEGISLIVIGKIRLLTVGGLEKGVCFLLRIMAIIVPASIMISTGTREIIQGLVQWKVPYEIAFMVSLAIRFLPLLSEEIKDTFIAIQLRGIELDKIPLGKRLRMYSYLFMPVLSGVILKARELSTALETRAFRAFPRRTSYRVLKLQNQDYLVMGMSLCFVIVVLTINFYYKGGF